MLGVIGIAACGGSSHMDGDDDDGGTVAAISLPQAIGNAMWVDPDAYATIPIHVVVEGEISRVRVAVDGVSVDAVKGTGD